MRKLRGWIMRFGGMVNKRRKDRELQEELESHIQMHMEDNLRSGMALEEARRLAIIKFGGIESTKESCRDQRGLPVLETIWQDIRFGVRTLRKSPGFACVTILILALGISGVTAMFSTLYAVMIRPLPYSDSDRLVLGRATYKGEINPWVAGPDFADYRDKSRSFSALGAFFCAPKAVTITSGGTAERAKSLITSAALFSTLGVNMFLGRSFTEDEGRDGAPPVVIINHSYWQKHFAGQADVVGRSLVIDGVSYDLVGVTPPGFHFIQDVDVWFPLRPEALGPRQYHNWFIFGRLRDGVSLAEGQSDMDVISAQLQKAYPDTDANLGLLLTPLQGAFAEQYRSSFDLLCGGTAAVLLIAWANAAGLLLARGATREGELAVRAAMGASRWRLMRLFLIEALILAVAAGVAGAIAAVWIQHALLRLMPIETLLVRDVGLSLPVLLFVIATTVLTGLGFGLLPMWRARHVNLAQAIRSNGRGMLQKGVRLRGGLVAGQLAASFVLLVVAGLLTRSLTSLHRANPGFNYRNLLTAEVPLPPGTYSDPQRVAFFAALLDNVRSLPGVASAAAISQLPLRNPYNNISIYAADAPPANPAEGFGGYQRVVLPGYFKTMGIPLLAGRDIQTADGPESARVVVLSQQLAKTLFPNRDALGKQVVIDRANDVKWEVVGVVGDVKQDNLYQERGLRGTFYRAHTQQSQWATMNLAIRTTENPLAMVASLHSVLQHMDRDVPLSGPRTMEDIIANSTVSEKAMVACLTTFSLLALTLAAVGIYGLLAYLVAQRQRDIGIRMALGAQKNQILGLVIGGGMKLVVIGVTTGLMAAFALSRLMHSLLYGIQPTDPFTFVAVSLLLAIVALLACWLPARRAAKVDPMVALRYE